MSGELIIKDDSLIKVLEKKDLGEVIKPLVREIYLFETFVAGTTYVDHSALETVAVGDKLKLQREDNKFDSMAVLVLKENGDKIGYIPEKDNAVFARLMDAGKLLSASISKIQNMGTFKRISIGIFLVDF